MKSLTRSIALASLGTAMAAGVYFALLQSTAAPEVTFTTIEGERLSTADLRGAIVRQYLGEPDFDALHALLEGKLAEKT